jgi:uncharacterized damage-inducible protein DinB
VDVKVADSKILITNQLDGLFMSGGNGWHAPFATAVEGLSAATAARRPAPGVNSIWDIVNHMAYEQGIALHRLRGLTGKPAPFAPPGPAGHPNWPAPDAAGGQAAWEAAVHRLLDTHREIVTLLEGMSPAELLTTPPGKRWPPVNLAQGLVGHNSYHAGQIVLLRRLGADWKEWAPA